MSNPQLAAGNPISPEDDIPRTFRREREARERDAREREAAKARTPPSPPVQPAAKSVSGLAIPRTDDRAYPDAPSGSADGVNVTGFDVPFGKLAAFMIKAVLAGIPALILLMIILWVFGQALTMFVPQLVKLRILVTFPG